MRWEQSIPYHKRYLCGPRLQAELQGTAKKLVVGKRHDWLSFAGGVEHLLDYLRQRLGKPQIPDLSDYLNQYFRQSKRKKFESMNNYIVRKVEVYARARQALARVQRHYGLRTQRHETRARSYGAGSTWSSRPSEQWRDQQSEGPANHPSSTASQDGSGNNNQEEDLHEANSGDEGWDQQRDWWDGWSSWRGGPWSSYSKYASDNADWVENTDELLPDFLQGWYLLADANLDTQERNLIQTAVAGDFSLERIAQELRSQFPEMDLMHRDQQHKPSSFWQEDIDMELDDEKEPNDLVPLSRIEKFF